MAYGPATGRMAPTVTVLLHNSPLLCDFNVGIKGLMVLHLLVRQF